MPIRTNMLERMAFALDRAPALMLDYLGAQAFQVFAAARRLGVFDVLADGPLPAAQVAARIGADPRATELLLRTLAAIGYLRESEGAYKQSAMTTRWLPLLGDGVPFFDLLLDRLHQLDDTVRRGAPVVDAHTWLDRRPDGWRDFQAGMIALARMNLDEVVTRLRLPADARRLLDVGGGHGLYAAALCRRHPELTATVFDLAPALEAARGVVAAEGMTERVTLRAGDFWIDPLGRDHDVVLLFNILHGLSPEQNVELLGKVAAGVRSGGVLAILDQLSGGSHGPTAAAVAALSGMALFELTGGQAYSFEVISEWLETAGFGEARCIRLRSSPGSCLIVATRGEEPAS